MKQSETTTAGFGETLSNPTAGGFRASRLSVITLVAANLVPLAGVVLAGWRVFPVLLLFSLENIVIGFYNVLRMRRSPCDLEELRNPRKGVYLGGLSRANRNIRSKKELIRVFCLVYSMCVFIHLLFVVVIFGLDLINSPAAPDLVPMGGGTYVHPGFRKMLEEDYWWGIGLAFLCLFVSHGISYVTNFVKGGEYERVTANDLFLQPFRRVVVMHVTIIIGALAVVVTGTSTAPIAVLVMLKLVMDLVAHLKERKKFQAAGGGGEDC